jgi:hypothetical protein
MNESIEGQPIPPTGVEVGDIHAFIAALENTITCSIGYKVKPMHVAWQLLWDGHTH